MCDRSGLEVLSAEKPTGSRDTPTYAAYEACVAASRTVRYPSRMAWRAASRKPMRFSTDSAAVITFVSTPMLQASTSAKSSLASCASTPGRGGPSGVSRRPTTPAALSGRTRQAVSRRGPKDMRRDLSARSSPTRPP